MGKRIVLTLLGLVVFFSSFCGSGDAGERIVKDVVAVEVTQQYEAVLPGGESALAVGFELKEDWHFYASAATAPGGMHLKVVPGAEGIVFGEAILPAGQMYYDKSVKKELEVFSDKFVVFVPFTVGEDYQGDSIEVEIEIAGAVCSQEQCRMPDLSGLSTEVKITKDISEVGEARFDITDYAGGAGGDVESGFGWSGYSVGFALFLAFSAGLVLNIMPCVWPVLPLIVMRIIEQSRQSKSRSEVMGVAFCGGILAFFAALAGANIVLQVFYGRALQWGDQLRSPVLLGGMSLLMVVLALFMFGVFSISLPSSLAGKGGEGKGFSGAAGMGFLAAVLSTPCSFGILAAAFAWAQTQDWPLATVGIMFIGLGMAAPYAVLIAMPALLHRLPKAGGWMELFKQGLGFVLLVIAVKLIGALPRDMRVNILYYAIVLGFCVWMWGSWVSYNSRLSSKIIIRVIAVVLAAGGAMALMPAGAAAEIDWQSYDAEVIESAKAQDRPILIKFTADWCLSCQVIEKTVYGKEDVARLIKEKNVLAIKGDTTRLDQAATIALKNIYNEPGVPVSMLFVPGEEGAAVWRGLTFAAELREKLESIDSK